jgi:hypothetical protein
MDFGAYDALSTRIGWDEAQRIATALTVIGDEREDYTEWRKEREKKGARSAGGPVRAGLSAQGLATEIGQQSASLERVKGQLADHRAWIVTSGAQGRAFTDEQVATLETMEETHKAQIAAMRAQLAEHGGPA